MPRSRLVHLPNAGRHPNEPIVLPPLHRDVLLRRGKNVPPLEQLDPETTLQQVYTNHREKVIQVPLKAISYMPPAGQHVARLILCAAYDGTEGSCTKRRCKFVHADVDRSAVLAKGVHVNYAWRSLQECRYERYPPGEVLQVAIPNTRVPSDVMDSDTVLKTNALRSKIRRPLCHCAHYYYNRTCNLGADCHFIHAVFVDARAGPNQRAPVPEILGRGPAWVAAQTAKTHGERTEYREECTAAGTMLDG